MHPLATENSVLALTARELNAAINEFDAAADNAPTMAASVLRPSCRSDRRY